MNMSFAPKKAKIRLALKKNRPTLLLFQGNLRISNYDIKLEILDSTMNIRK